MTGLFIVWAVLAFIGGIFGLRKGLSRANKVASDIPEVNRGINVIEYEVYKFNKSLNGRG